MNRKLFAPLGIIVFILVSLLASGGTGEASCGGSPCGGFKPQWGPAGTTPVTLTPSTVGGHPDIFTALNIDAPSSNFAESVTLADGAVTEFALPIGTYVGSLASVASLGLANSGCWNQVQVGFNFVSASVNIADTIAPGGPATNVDANFAEDLNGNGIADGADKYPTFLNDAFNNAQPLARYQGVAFVANSLIVLLNLVVFPPGGLAALPNHSWMTSAWGYPSVAVLNDPVAAPSNSAITDFCNFQSTTTLFGVAHDNGCTPVLTTVAYIAACQGTGAGFTLRFGCDGGATGGGTVGPPACAGSTLNEGNGAARVTSPATAGTVKWRQYAMSLRDADGDGITNGFDPCPFNADTVWDPYAVDNSTTGDADSDGLPATCDPNDAVPNTDQDLDGWLNRGDNCPKNANPGTGVTTPANTGQYDQDVAPALSVADGGPHTDAIGAVCDPNPGPPSGPVPNPAGNGTYAATVIAQTICIGGGGANALNCSTSADNDNDGIKNAFDNCIGVINGVNPPAGAANGPLNHAPPAGYSQSQRDLNADGFVDGTDNSILGQAFNTQGGNPLARAGFEGRLDLDYSNTIDGTDSSLLGNAFNTAC